MAGPVDRYLNLRAALDEHHASGARTIRFLEVGTYDAIRARALIAYWQSLPGHPTARYYGFDLWEAMTPELTQRELSKSRLPPSLDKVRTWLADAGIQAMLYPGNTRETLPRYCPELPTMDLVFLDGGHSLETVQSDWDALQPVIGHSTIVLLDDYYENRDDFGCRRLVRELQKPGSGYAVALLEPVDVYGHTGLEIRVVRVRKLVRSTG